MGVIDGVGVALIVLVVLEVGVIDDVGVAESV